MIVQLAFVQAAQDYLANEAKIEEGLLTRPSVGITVSIQGLGSFPGFVSYYPAPLLAGTPEPIGPSAFSGEFNSPPSRWTPPIYAGSITVDNFDAVAHQVVSSVLVQVSLGVLNRRGGRTTTSYAPFWSIDQRLQGNLDSPVGSSPQIEVVFGRYLAPSALFDLAPNDAIPGTITGVVTDDGGEPLAGSHVSINGIPPVGADANGRYRLASIHPGLVHVTASHGIHYLPDAEAVMVTSGETTEMDFVLVNRNKL